MKQTQVRKHTRNRHSGRIRQWWKALGLTIGGTMIAVSISPIPLGNASPKPPPSVKTSEISPTLPGQHHLQADIFSATDRVPIELGLERKPGITTSEQASGKPTRRTATVVKNDSLSTIFKRLGLPQSQLYAIMNAGKDSKRLKHLRPGQTLEFEIDKNGTIKKIIYRSNWESALEIALKQGGKGYRAQMIAEDFERRVMLATGTINRSLFLDGQRAGLSDKTIMQMVKIFAWDVDFALNVRPGDRFSVIYEQLHRNGEKIRTGNILAAEFINRGKTFRALRYENDKGKVDYYTPEGRGMRKAFLRTPVEFSRISSRFQLRRMHPVLNRVRAHRGVDYAAPRGTPIKATAQGKVTFIGRKGGLGKAIFLQHRGNYTTVYGHMHKYARGIKRGKSIRQGQTIGYVGSTGLATGPHLHYEFRVRGVHKDPLKVKLPQSQPIEARYRADFRRKAEKLIVKLNILSRTRLASRE